jgi:hypothetical protein
VINRYDNATQTEAEGVDNAQIHKKQLKSGREIWTLGGPA